ncbi:hypothetical protein GGX14DRAFT_554038 [Mycena pura]|uniref:Uncharacterized protein n=1 Tax=Mycena pura TaxID=153505 RepID=A0AAD6YVU5_9AGAR|nr:hypothetical protein GGX14DRAFT_554038 [Mycena pura]
MAIPGASSSSRADSLILLNTPAGSSALSSVVTHVGLDDAIVLGGISGNGDVVHKGATLNVVPCTAFSRRDRFFPHVQAQARARMGVPSHLTSGRAKAEVRWCAGGDAGPVPVRADGGDTSTRRMRARSSSSSGGCRRSRLPLRRRSPRLGLRLGVARLLTLAGETRGGSRPPGVDVDADAGECKAAPPLAGAAVRSVRRARGVDRAGAVPAVRGLAGPRGSAAGTVMQASCGDHAGAIPFMAHYNALVGTPGVLVWDDLATPCVHADRGALVVSRPPVSLLFHYPLATAQLSSCVRGGAAEAGRVGWRARGRAVSRVREGARWATDQERTSKGLDEEGNS